jgi:hypothetical protein
MGSPEKKRQLVLTWETLYEIDDLVVDNRLAMYELMDNYGFYKNTEKTSDFKEADLKEVMLQKCWKCKREKRSCRFKEMNNSHPARVCVDFYDRPLREDCPMTKLEKLMKNPYDKKKEADKHWKWQQERCPSQAVAWQLVKEMVERRTPEDMKKFEKWNEFRRKYRDHPGRPN